MFNLKDNPDIISVYKVIYDDLNNLRGYLCRNFTTGEFVIYYIDNFTNILKKYDKNNYNGSCAWLFDETLQGFLNKDKLPKELLDLAKPICEKHIQYNIKHGLPYTSEKEFNQIYFNYHKEFSFFIQTLGLYRPELKMLNLNISENEWNNLSDDKRKKWICIFEHELGHAKTNFGINFNREKNTLSFKINGKFYEYLDVPLVFQPLNDGNLWINDTIKSMGNSDPINVCLEELANECECLEIFPDYMPGYPLYAELAPTLNKLTDGGLIKARYSGGESYLRSQFLNLIKDENLYLELFNTILNLQNTKFKKYRDKLNKILDTYHQAKTQKEKQ